MVSTYGPRGYVSPGEGLTPPPGVSLMGFILTFDEDLSRL